MCIYRVCLFECFPSSLGNRWPNRPFFSSSSPQELSTPSSLLLQFSNHLLPNSEPPCDVRAAGGDTQYCAMEKGSRGRIGSMVLIKPFTRVSTSEAERALHGVRTPRPCVEARVAV